jgi:hypothetical protein
VGDADGEFSEETGELSMSISWVERALDAFPGVPLVLIASKGIDGVENAPVWFGNDDEEKRGVARNCCDPIADC